MELALHAAIGDEQFGTIAKFVRQYTLIFSDIVKRRDWEMSYYRSILLRIKVYPCQFWFPVCHPIKTGKAVAVNYQAIMAQ